jgi:hypothetical protein
VKLDSLHYMMQFSAGLTTEHHSLYPEFCTGLSNCIFQWDKDDLYKLAIAADFRKQYRGREPTMGQMNSFMKREDLAKHCRHSTRGAEVTCNMIANLLDELVGVTDSTGMHLINQEKIAHVWRVQQWHLECIEDPKGVVVLYTQTGTIVKGGVELPVYHCARGTSSLESFHNTQKNFIPG